MSEDCIDEAIALDNDIGIDKVVSGMVAGQADNAQSPQGANGGQGAGGGAGGLMNHHHAAPKQEFLHRCFVFCL